MDISSIAWTNFASSSLDVPAADVDSIGTGCDVAIGDVGANEAADVEGIVVETVGMKFTDVVCLSLYFNWNKVSNSFSVSLN